MEEIKELDKVKSEKNVLFIHGKEREIKFGFTAWGELEKKYGGIKHLDKLQKEIKLAEAGFSVLNISPLIFFLILVPLAFAIASADRR